jgi:hypothetical protein
MAWPKLLQDASLILAAADVLVTGPSQTETEITPPIIDEERGIIFNGVEKDGHESFCLARKNGIFARQLESRATWLFY